jgi:thiamine-phosphate pyrophosphorylase
MDTEAERGAARAVSGLYVLLDDDPRWARDPVEQARAALAGGAAVLQLRTKHATDQIALGWARAIVALARARGVPFFFNDRFDLALASGAAGVHLGQSDLPPSRIPRLARSKLLIGRSTHTLEQMRAEQAEDVDYLAFGPIFGTSSKVSSYPARGLALLSEACAPRFGAHGPWWRSVGSAPGLAAR